MSLPAARLDDVFFVSRRVLAMLRDPKMSAERLARVIEAVDALDRHVVAAANEVYGPRGRVIGTAAAITVLGFVRLETVVRGFLQRTMEELADEAPIFAPETRLRPRYAHL